MTEKKDVIFLTRVPEPELREFKYPIIPLIPKPFPGGMSSRIWEYVKIVLKKDFKRYSEILERVQPLPPDDPHGGRRFFHIHLDEGIVPLDRKVFKDVFIKATTQMVESMDEKMDYGGFLDLISTLAIDTVPLPEREYLR
jgi:hypothetical protein